MRTIVMAALLPLAACGNYAEDDTPGIEASGTGSSRTFAATDFRRVQLAGSDNVEVRVGPGFSVRAEGDPQVLNALRITTKGDDLRVSRRSGSSTGQARVFVTMPAITGADIGGSGNMMIDRVEGQAFGGRIAGSGNLAIGQLRVEAVDFSVAGSGDLSAAGEAGKLEVNIAGSGNLDAPQLSARSAEVSIAGSGNVRAVVKGSAEVNSLGSGDVDLGPDARCTVRKMGSGEVRCGR